MNILHIYKDYYPVFGGIENHVKDLAEGLAARGHTINVLVTSLDRRTQVETLNGVRIVKTSRWVHVASTPLSPSMFVWARRLGRDADVVHLHFPYPPGEVAYLLSGSRAPAVISYHSDIVRQKSLLRLYRPVLWRVLNRVDCILPTSPRYVETSPVLRRYRDKCRVVPLGVDVGRFAAASTSRVAELRDRLSNPPTDHLLLSVGRLRYYKGLDTLICALPDLPTARAVIVGTGPMESEWRELAQAQGVGERVTFAGDVPDVDLVNYFHAADVYVLPANARAEAYGIALVEAMAAGLPCVTTEVGTGTSWVVQDGVTGIVVPPHNPAAMARAVAGLLEDPDRRRIMARAAAQRARQEFDKRLMVDRVLAVYQSLT